MQPTAQPGETTRAPAPASSEPSPRILIEDNALIGDLHTAALVAKDGSINFMCLPDFDSDACFASILGTPENGRWRIAPLSTVREVRRRYRDGTLILETDFITDSGTLRLVDFMPVRSGVPHVVRWVECLDGEVEVDFDLRPRFGNGYTTPHVLRRNGSVAAMAGPDALYLHGGIASTPPPFQTHFVVRAGERIPFILSWARPYDAIPEPIDPDEALKETQGEWSRWASKLNLPSRHQALVLRSLITLRACCYRPSGAIVAAPTFGLPETPGGERNWDYRFCWVRDAVLTLSAMIAAGRSEEARDFGDWLNNAVGAIPSQLQIMYGIRGERRLTEVELDWLPGYEGARPVRIGNGAYNQFQLDVIGELAAVLYIYVKLLGNLPERARRNLELIAQRAAESWTQKDHGIWEMRGPKQDFTASKVAAWTAVDRWVRVIEEYDLEVDPTPWVDLKQRIFDEVLAKGYDPVRNTFTQYYGSKGLDASLLIIAQSGFLPVTDPRVVGTIQAIEQELIQDGLVLRYRTEEGTDGLRGEEGTFLACSFWLATTYQLMGREEDARRLFERVAGLANDVGLLAEEYLPAQQRQTGNFPQAFSHLALVNCAYTLWGDRRPVAYQEAVAKS